jgi:CBS domain-containing protein
VARKRRRVGELMNPDVVTLPADATVGEARKRLAERGVSGAPVVDDTGRVLGVVSQNDLVRLENRRETAGESGRFFSDVDDYGDLAQVRVDQAGKPISSLMTRDLHFVTRDTGAAVAANIMRERRIHRLLVLDSGVLVGIVTSLDLLRVVEEAC